MGELYFIYQRHGLRGYFSQYAVPFTRLEKQVFRRKRLLKVEKRMRRNNLGFSFFGIAPKK
jgi:hypothetical protein